MQISRAERRPAAQPDEAPLKTAAALDFAVESYRVGGERAVASWLRSTGRAGLLRAVLTQIRAALAAQGE